LGDEEKEQSEVLSVEIKKLKEVARYSTDLTIPKRGLEQAHSLSVRRGETRKSLFGWLREKKKITVKKIRGGISIDVMSANEEDEEVGQDK